MRILVSGGLGFIGSHLADKLHKDDHELVIVDNLETGKKENLAFKGPTVHIDDVSKRKTWELLPKCEAIYLLHCWPRSRSFQNPLRDCEVNYLATTIAAEYARKWDAQTILASNSGCFGPPQYLPMDEEHPDHPLTPYDANKMASEKLLRIYHEMYGIKVFLPRFATIYGPRQRVHPEWKPVIAEFIVKLLKEAPPTIYGDGSQTRDFTYVKDLVKALTISLTKPFKCEGAILGSGSSISILDLYELLTEITGKDLGAMFGPPTLADIPEMSYDCSKAEKLLGWKAETLIKKGLEATVRWWRNEVKTEKT